MKKRIFIFANWAVVFLLLFVIACDTSDMEESVPRIVTRIEVSPAENILEVGEQLKFNAIAYDQQGQPIERLWIDWGSSTEAIASVSNVGMVSALASGETIISASAGGVSGSAGLKITAPDPEASRVSNLTVNEEEVTLGIGRSKSLECRVYDQHGTTLSGLEINWQSSDNSVVTVDSGGRLTGLKAGTAKVQASVGKHRSEVQVTVSDNASLATQIVISPQNIVKARGEAAEFTAMVYDQYGSIMEDVQVDWVSNDICTVSIDANGNAAALSTGDAEIEARIGNVSGKGNIRVSPSPVKTPASISGTWIVCSSSPKGYIMTVEISKLAGSDEISAIITDADGITGTASGTYANNVLSLRWETIVQGKSITHFIRRALPIDQFLLEGIMVNGQDTTEIRISRALN